MSKEKQLILFEQQVKGETPYIAIGGGKGGVGKTFVTYLLANRLSQKGKVLVLDADMGLPDFYIISGIKPKKYLEDYFEGKATLDETVTPVSSKLHLISPKSGSDYLVGLEGKKAVELLNKLEEFIADNYDYFLIDLGAGIHKINQLIFASVHYPILVLNPDIMSIVDAYGFVKAVFQNYRKTYFYAVVNRAKDKFEYQKAVNVLSKSAQSFHKNIHIEGLGFVPYHPKAGKGEIPSELYKFADQILENLLKERYVPEKPKKGGILSRIFGMFRRT